uniref:Uncharacterized protein n=1 Tax=Salix viminalis TaxID=40686 RepID=A0A6N2M7A7_SALVM
MRKIFRGTTIPCKLSLWISLLSYWTSIGHGKKKRKYSWIQLLMFFRCWFAEAVYIQKKKKKRSEKGSID